MTFWNDWYNFIKTNAEKNMKRFSITIGSFLVLIISSIGLGLDAFIIVLYAGIVESSAIIIMTLFGKNGNGNTQNAINNNDNNNEHKPEVRIP